MEAYLSGDVGQVDLLYHEFKSVIQQKLVIERLLPVSRSEVEEGPKEVVVRFRYREADGQGIVRTYRVGSGYLVVLFGSVLRREFEFGSLTMGLGAACWLVVIILPTAAICVLFHIFDVRIIAIAETQLEHHW